ncbi:hypothetical protein Hbl1158_07885 [Halobaculum sp. CBA1158]|uniref:DUF7471 family protein n=1 Tax=Halobaculum sp. CBA1158 TaxID=2904243 RepID=UPI001F1ABDD1|nr:hypothetical protein [Halobaculum sp. CBA1158]UIO98485.1 hypothetical protein Hbl1158_07885 [Halobaculum sp. CBA1158]
MIGPLHVAPGAHGVAYALVVVAGGVAGAGLLGLALAAFARRRSRSYLLVALALGTLVARAGLATATAVGLVGAEAHHFGEHLLDVVMAGLVLGAVYYARTIRTEATS